jgi:hypothetical protein
MSTAAVPLSRGLSSRQRLQIVAITVAALGLYLFFRALPVGSNLNHVDFRVEGSNAIEFCDPSNPQFIPVVAVRSPVVTRLTAATPPEPGRETRFTLALATSSGKPIGPNDLVTMHTRKLHLLVVDPTLQDYQHLHPEPGERPGEWVFAHTPRLAGGYRVFADFTPTATGRGLYASADFEVPGEVPVNMVVRDWTYELDGYRFSLRPDAEPVRAGRMATLVFSVERPDGGAVPMSMVMDAYAHLVAFDRERSGFAHLHPDEYDLSHAPDPRRPVLTFRITIPKAGLYVIWAQVNLGGAERFVPFWFEVAP